LGRGRREEGVGKRMGRRVGRREGRQE